MLITILLLSIIGFTIGCTISRYLNSQVHQSDDWINYGVVVSIISVVTFIFTLFFTITCICEVIDARYLDESIAMYEEENQKIEQSIALTVENYQKYETDIFKDVSNSHSESPMILLTLYPELKSDALVQKQIEVYVSNNEKIIELKAQKIRAKSSKWWLYFGS